MSEKNSNIETKKAPKWVRFLFGGLFKDPNLRAKLPYFGFLYCMIILYIGIGYYAEGLVKQINRTERNVKEKRAQYISIKSELMDLTKQSRLARELQENKSGIIESVSPPKKIIISE